MESDDDYQSFSPPEESSPPAQTRKLKRLKKRIRVSEDPVINSSEDVSWPILDSSNSEGLESSEALDLENSNEPLKFGSVSVGLDEEKESDYGFESSDLDRDGLKFKSVSELDSVIREDDVSVPVIDSLNSEAFESSETLDLEDSNEPLRFGSESVSLDEEKELSLGFESSHLDRNGLKVKRVLEFDSVDGEVDGRGEGGGGEMEGEVADSDMEKHNSEGSKEKKEKKRKKRVKSDYFDGKRKETASNKRRAEKERRDYLNHLHAESQRLLRENRNAAFKPVPTIQKPISSVLEKIRKRKLELLKKTVSLNSTFSTSENDDSSRDIMMDLDSETPLIPDRMDDEIVKVVNEDTVVHTSEDTVVHTSEDTVVHATEKTVVHTTDVGSNLNVPDINRSSESADDSNPENVPLKVALDEESKNAFRAPIDDTQDLYCDSQSSDTSDDLPSDQNDSPVEEPFAPSILAMNLKFDSALPEDMSSDEEENDKENISPGLKLCSSPKGDPVKAFVDEEAEEEDDGDNDLFRFQDNEEDDDIADAEELKDMIATGYEEKPIDDEKRHQLHQKWLEQQDAVGTDNLLQRLGCGSNQREATLLEEEEDSEEDEEEFSDEDAEDRFPMNARINAKKVKQMIPLMFTDKDDTFLSSDDEETEKMLVKHRLLKKAEEHAKFLSPVEDESSREVFGLIKKLNIVPEAKRKAKTPSSFDMPSARRSNNSSKSTFLGRVTNSSLSSSRKQGSGTMRSFIFGRDDSNSKSAISISEDSSDTVQKEVVRPTKTPSAKFSNSQSKSCSQNTKITETISGTTSLFDILRRSSQQTNNCNRDTMVGQTQSVFAAFKLSKKSIKIERGS